MLKEVFEEILENALSEDALRALDGARLALNAASRLIPAP